MDTPELNAIAERMNRELGERTRVMMSNAGLAIEFWANAYDTAVLLYNSLPTKTAFGFVAPHTAACGEIPDLHWIRTWGAKGAVGIPRVQRRKNLAETHRTGYLIGYSKLPLGWIMYMPDSKKDEVSVVFDEDPPLRSEEYFKAIDEAIVTTDPIARDLKDFRYLEGQFFFNADRFGNRHQFVVSRLAVYKGFIVAYRKPVIGPGQFGQEQKTPYHVADIAKLAQTHDQFVVLSRLEVDEGSSGQSDSKAPQMSMPEVEERGGGRGRELQLDDSGWGTTPSVPASCALCRPYCRIQRVEASGSRVGEYRTRAFSGLPRIGSARGPVTTCD